MTLNDVVAGLVGGGISAALTFALVRTVYASRLASLQERVGNRDETLRQLTGELERSAQELGGARSEIRSLTTEFVETKARLESELGAARDSLEQLGQIEVRFRETFGALANEALKSNNDAFLTLARDRFNEQQQRASTDLLARQEAIGGLLKPLDETLRKVDQRIEEVEKSRKEAYGSLTEQIRGVGEASRRLEQETANLVTALRAPAVRGRWGEIQLRRVVEIAGMLPYCDFVEQPSMQGEEGRLRPDLIVRLPNNRTVVVDAKTPLQHYLEALDARLEPERRDCLSKHAAQVRQHIQKLSTKAYWDTLESTPEFVVLFLPGETFFSAALESDPSLIEYGVDNRVILATPTTLISLLKAVAYGWRQDQLAENAQEISDLGRQLYDRLRVLGTHFEDMRHALENLVSGYNKAIGSLEGRVLVTARRFKDLGVLSTDDLPILEGVEVVPRRLSAPELSAQTDLDLDTDPRRGLGPDDMEPLQT